MLIINDQRTCPHRADTIGGGICHAFQSGLNRCANGHAVSDDAWVALPAFILGFEPDAIAYEGGFAITLPSFILGEYDDVVEAHNAFAAAQRPPVYLHDGLIILLQYAHRNGDAGYRHAADRLS